MSEVGLPHRRHVVYEGTVQGVGFRYATQRIASRFAVMGFVRNLRDGRVEVVAEGLPGVLDQFLATIGGQMGDYVTRTHVTVHPATDEFRQFEIRH